MELDTILVAVLSAGVVALLVWFEVNSRRNEARRDKQRESVHRAENDTGTVPKAETSDKKAA